MALRIACDLDGTVADMESALQQHAEALFGPDVDIRFNGGAQREAPRRRATSRRLTLSWRSTTVLRVLRSRSCMSGPSI